VYKILVVLLIVAMFGMLKFAHAEMAVPRVRLETNYGVIVLKLDQQAAPKTVENFLGYVRDGFYDGTIFHRVIEEFMIQGGGFTADMQRKSTNDPIQNEADNGLKNLSGTIAMARTMDPRSATSQFFINTVDNPYLDHKAKTSESWGYCVFGKVIEGMDVVKEIEAVKTTSKGSYKDVPVEAVIIEKAEIVEE
jgi:peptidyl-prolyl cis-trans isomerase B (cyclophilin B)